MEKERIAALEEAQQKEEEKLEDERKWKDMLREQMLELRDREAEVRHRYTTPVRLTQTQNTVTKLLQCVYRVACQLYVGQHVKLSCCIPVNVLNHLVIERSKRFSPP